MPLVDLTFSPAVPIDTRRRVVADLPEIVSVAVACAAEPYDGRLGRGDVILRVHEPGPLDRFDVDVLVEIASKWFADRAADRQRRADRIRDDVQRVVGADRVVGVYLSLPVAAWAQSG